tara:strand:+ start:339 stop:521 length:183 start_codon:yes stop_codon:yes gene_type:complete
LKELLDKIVRMSILYYSTDNADAKLKVKDQISKIVKKSHKFRETNKKDYEFMTKLARNIT